MPENSTLQIELEKISKRFIRDWIFRDFDFVIRNQEKIVIRGGNGSGKSTLLQVISGYQSVTGGKIRYQLNGNQEESEKFFLFTSMATPYLELIEDFSFVESVLHQKLFKPFQQNLSVEEITKISGIHPSDAQKPLKNFSSGMKQRAKLTLAMLADCPLLLLDEPCSNLDKNGIQWYREMIQNYCLNKTIIVCSNDQIQEFDFCTREINMEQIKKSNITGHEN